MCFKKSFCQLEGSWTEAGMLLESGRSDNDNDEDPSQVWMVAVRGKASLTTELWDTIEIIISIPFLVTKADKIECEHG